LAPLRLAPHIGSRASVSACEPQSLCELRHLRESVATTPPRPPHLNRRLPVLSRASTTPRLTTPVSGRSVPLRIVQGGTPADTNSCPLAPPWSSHHGPVTPDQSLRTSHSGPVTMDQAPWSRPPVPQRLPQSASLVERAVWRSPVHHPILGRPPPWPQSDRCVVRPPPDWATNFHYVRISHDFPYSDAGPVQILTTSHRTSLAGVGDHGLARSPSLCGRRPAPTLTTTVSGLPLAPSRPRFTGSHREVLTWIPQLAGPRSSGPSV